MSPLWIFERYKQPLRERVHDNAITVFINLCVSEVNGKVSYGWMGSFRWVHPEVNLRIRVRMNNRFRDVATFPLHSPAGVSFLTIEYISRMQFDWGFSHEMNQNSQWFKMDVTKMLRRRFPSRSFFPRQFSFSALDFFYWLPSHISPTKW